MKPSRKFAFFLLLAVWVSSAAGCVSIPQKKQVTIFADTALSSVLNTTAIALKKQDGLSMHIRYGKTDELKQAVDTGAHADLLVLGGKSETGQGSYTFGSPAVRALMQTHKVDNYANVAIGTDGSAYSIAKPLASKNFAAAQTVVDFLLSENGVRLLEANGFSE